MATKWYYNNTAYNTEAEVNQAVVDMKTRLDNNPSYWAIVKALTGSQEAGWLVPTESLTDAEINDLDQSGHYSISSVFGGGTEIGLPASDIPAKVAEYRVDCAQALRVDSITSRYNPTNEDMSGYMQ
tara:strand:+ start:103 stop:483 length:381 start_codon:yes stop_codon:yes gene_type:complete